MQKIDHIYTVFITARLKETVEFYEQYFGLSKVFESTFFVLIQTTGEQKFSLAFMDETHPTAPPSPERFNGTGAFLTLEVSNAKNLFDEMKTRGHAITYDLKDEDWGQRRFGILDPNGLWIDVVEQVAPKDGYWDPFINK